MWFLLPADVIEFPAKSVYFSIPYLMLAAFVVFQGKFFHINSFSQKGFNKTAFYILFCVIFCFFAFRWHLLSDSVAYAEEFKTIEPVFSLEYLDAHSRWWDKGFLILAMLCKFVTNDFAFFVFINSLIDFVLFYFVIKRHAINIPLTLLLFLSFNGVLMEANLMRNMKAILLFMFSIRFIENRCLWKFLLCNILGFFMHSTAIVFFPMYWILNRKINRKILIAGAIFFTIIYIANIDILNNLISSILLSLGQVDSVALNKFSYYFENSHEQILSIGTLERVVTLCLAIYMYIKEKDKMEQWIVIFLNSFFVFYVFYAIFGYNLVFRDRFATLFYYSYWFLFPCLVKHFGRKFKCAYLLLVLFAFLKIYSFTSNCSAYYETVLTHNTTVSERVYLNTKTSNTMEQR